MLSTGEETTLQTYLGNQGQKWARSAQAKALSQARIPAKSSASKRPGLWRPPPPAAEVTRAGHRVRDGDGGAAASGARTLRPHEQRRQELQSAASASFFLTQKEASTHRAPCARSCTSYLSTGRMSNSPALSNSSRVRVQTHTHPHTCTRARTSLTHTCVPHTHTQTHRHMGHTRSHKSTRTHTSTCSHTHVHTLTRTCTHTQEKTEARKFPTID